jgi:translation initiation factor IF-2
MEGYATVRAIFNVGRRSKAAGIYVNDGRISRGAEIRVVRRGKPQLSGSVVSLKHFKDDVRELGSGLEGGIVLEGFQDYQVDDVLESHISELED